MAEFASGAEVGQLRTMGSLPGMGEWPPLDGPPARRGDGRNMLRPYGSDDT